MAKKSDKSKKEYDGSTPITGRYAILQEAFVNNLIANIVQYKAYQKAGYKTKSAEIAKAAASRLLTNVKVKARLAYKRAELAKKTDISAERVIRELAKIGFSNIQEYVKKGNRIKDMSKLSPEMAAAVESVQTDAKGCKLKLHSKLGALNSLAEILKLKDVAGKTDMAVQIVNFADRPLEAKSVQG